MIHRSALVLALGALLGLGAATATPQWTRTAWAQEAPEASPAQTKALKRALAHLAKGHSEVTRSARQKSNAKRLQVLDRALYFLRRAKSVAGKAEGAAFDDLRSDVDRATVGALLDQGSIHFARKSLGKAQQRAESALAIDADNARAKKLLTSIRDAREKDIYEELEGSAAVNRIRQRRSAAGVPLRDRGAARRR